MTLQTKNTKLYIFQAKFIEVYKKDVILLSIHSIPDFIHTNKSYQLIFSYI